MNAPASFTAVVLAGTRSGGDPLASHAGVTHKALIDIGGRSMLERVVSALAAVSQVTRIVVSIERPDIVESLPARAKPIATLPAASSPSASVAAALATYGAPMLVTTADHALLQPQWIEQFLTDTPPQADVVVGLARKEAIIAAVPNVQRTYLRFAEGEYSGCNLFLLQTPAAAGVVRFWQALEADRKHPLRMLRRLGIGYALRYGLGRLRLDDALARLGLLAQARIAVVTLQDGRAAVDVDKPADLELVRRLVLNQEPIS